MPLRSRLLSKFALLFTAVFVISAARDSAHADSLVVTVGEIRNDECDIQIALYSSNDNFLVHGLTAATQSLSARRGDAKVVFVDFRPRILAAAAYHVENRSRNFDTDFIGVPREGYEFAIGVATLLGSPDFEEESVKLVRNTAYTDLLLNYW